MGGERTVGIATKIPNILYTSDTKKGRLVRVTQLELT